MITVVILLHVTIFGFLTEGGMSWLAAFLIASIVGGAVFFLRWVYEYEEENS